MPNFMTGFQQGYDWVDRNKRLNRVEARNVEDRDRRINREDVLYDRENQALADASKLTALNVDEFNAGDPEFADRVASGDPEATSLLNKYASGDPRVQSFMKQFETKEGLDSAEKDVATLEGAFTGKVPKAEALDAANRVLKPFLDHGSGGKNKRLADIYPSQSGKGFHAELEMDDDGNEIDMSRLKIQNADGSFSTEKTITIGADGKYFNIPTIIDGKQVSNDEAVAAFRAGTNKPVGVFDTNDEAVKAAVSRSKAIGRKRAPLTSPNRSPEDTEVKEIPAADLAYALKLLKHSIASQRVALGDTGPIKARSQEAERALARSEAVADKKLTREEKLGDENRKNKFELEKLAKTQEYKKEIEKLKVRGGTSGNAPADQQLTEYLVRSKIYPDRKAAWSAVRKSKSDPVRIASDMALKEIAMQSENFIEPGDPGYRSPELIRENALKNVLKMYNDFYGTNTEKDVIVDDKDPLGLL